MGQPTLAMSLDSRTIPQSSGSGRAPSVFRSGAEGVTMGPDISLGIMAPRGSSRGAGAGGRGIMGPPAEGGLDAVAARDHRAPGRLAGGLAPVRRDAGPDA